MRCRGVPGEVGVGVIGMMTTMMMRRRRRRIVTTMLMKMSTMLSMT